MAEQYRYGARVVAGTWPRPNAVIDVEQVLRYYFLRALVHLGCGDLVLAHRCLWTCLSIPGNVCSRIMMEAWKKLVLVQCLKHRVSIPDQTVQVSLPANVPVCLVRRLTSIREAHGLAVKSDSSGPEIYCYMDLEKAFYMRDTEKFESCMAAHEKFFREASNWGLVNQCHTKLKENQIRHLSLLYSTVPVSTVAECLRVQTSQIRRILCESQVPCEIQDDGMIVFTSDTSGDESVVELMDLDEWVHLLDRVQKLDVSIACTQKYLSISSVEATDSKGPAGVGLLGRNDF